MRQLFNVPKDVNTRIYNKKSEDSIELEHLYDLEWTVFEAGIYENHLLILEKQGRRMPSSSFQIVRKYKRSRL